MSDPGLQSTAASERRRWLRLAAPLLLLTVMAGGVLLLPRAGLRNSPHRTLVIESRPPGASVLLNGRLAGASPLRVTGLSAGNYSVRLEKEGHVPLVRSVRLEEGPVKLSEELQRAPVGGLKVDVEPAGADVLLDGELVGHTPLWLPAAPAGPHELMVRRANFETFTQRVVLRAGETAQFSGFALQDAILKMLRQRLEVEPWRVGYATELGQYLFSNGKQLEAAEALVRGMAIGEEPLALPPDMGPQDRQAEQRLRDDDLRRLVQSIQRMWSWPNKDTAAFRARLEEPDAAVKLICVRLRMREFNTAFSAARRFAERRPANPAAFSLAARRLSEAEASCPEPERPELRDAAEQLLRGALEAAANDADRALYAPELGGLLSRQGRADDVEKLYREVLALVSESRAQEALTFCLAECLVQKQTYREARTLYQRLAQSPREEVRRRAAAALARIPPAP